MKGVVGNKRAFTLIELLVVVLIIGVLAAVAIPQYQKVTEVSKAKMMLSVMESVKKAQDTYHLAHGTYTLHWEELDVLPKGTVLDGSGQYFRAEDGILYNLQQEGESFYVLSRPQPIRFMLYRGLSNNLWICYPQGTSTGKRVCKYLGCSDDELEKYACGFTWKP